MADFVDAADAALATGAVALIVDMADVSFVDSAGLSGLVQVRQQTLDAGSTFRLQSPSRVVARILELSGLDRLFDPAEEDPADRPD